MIEQSQAYVTDLEPRSGREGDVFLELLKYCSDVRVIRTRDQKWYVIARRAGVTSGRTHPELVRALWGALSKLRRGGGRNVLSKGDRPAVLR